MARFSGGSGGGEGTVGPAGPTGPEGPQGPAGDVGPLPFNYLGDFDYGVTYGTNDAVTFDGGLWKLNNFIGGAGYAPTPGQWTLILPPGEAGEGFNYLGGYQEGTTYEENDVVTYLGSSYISVGDSYGSPPISEGGNGGTNTGWSIFTSKGADGEGFTFRGEYDTSGATSYLQNDVVTFWNTTFLLSEISNYGQAPFDAWGNLVSPWQIFTPTTPNFRGEYNPDNQQGGEAKYVNGDVVTFNNSTYIVEPKGDLPIGYNYGDPDYDSYDNNWSLFVGSVAGEGFNWRSTWEEFPMESYVRNDLVSYNGSVYRARSEEANSSGPNGPAGDTMGWELFVSKGADGEGFTWRGEWTGVDNPSPRINDVFSYNGSSYVLVDPTIAYAPEDMDGNTGAGWNLLAANGEGFTFRGEYENSQVENPYEVNDLVTFEGSMYLCISSLSPMMPPISAGMPNTSQWTLFIQKPSGFNWRGTWSNMANPSYVAEDVVEYEGSTYICTPQMSPIMNYPPFFGPSSPTPGPNPDWELMSSAGEGFNWRGTWSNMNMTPYVANDVVNHNGSLYLAKDQGPNLAGTGTPDMYGNGGWVLMTQGFNWRGAWSSNPMGAYGVGDLVSYQGSVYLGVNNMGSPPSGTPGESMNYSWQLFLGSTAPKWRGEWSMMPTPLYAVNDLVSYNGSTWIGVPGSMNMGVMGTPGQSDTWELFTSSFRFRGNWMSNPMDTLGEYVDNDVVSYLGSTYIAKDNMNDAGVGTPGETLPENGGTSGWKLMASAGEGFVWKGGWQEPMPSMPYVEGDVVSYNSKIYVAKTPFMMSYEPGSGTPGEMGAGWELMLSAFNWRGAWIQDENPVYALNDVVEYNGSSYIATGGDSWQPPVSEGGSVNSGWSLLAAKGDSINWRGGWTNVLGTPYANNDLVEYFGSTYIVIDETLVTADAPDNNDGQGATQGWALVASKGTNGEGFNWRGVWDEFADPAYQDNDVIFYEGSSYVGQQIGAGSWSQPPGSNNDYWSLMAAEGGPASIDTATTTINSYSPVWSGTGLDINPTAPVPPATGSYIKIGNLVQVQIEVNFTEVLDFGTGQYSITLPFPSFYHTDVFGGSVHDAGSGVTHYSLKGHLEDGSNVATLWALSGSSQDQPFDNNSPVNLTTSDKFHMSFSYIANLT
jgi:hypothetical protein